MKLSGKLFDRSAKKLLDQLSLRNKILICFYIIILVVSITISMYYQNQHTKRITDTISQKHYTLLQQICSDITFIQDDLRDISTYLCIDETLQLLLEKDYTPGDLIFNNNSLSFIYNLIASKSYISSVIIYSNNETPLFYVFTDQSNGTSLLSNIKKTQLYEHCTALNGRPYWHQLSKDNHDLITNNSYSKLALSRIIINLSNRKDAQSGFMTITFNEEIIDNALNNVINENHERFVIYSSDGSLIYEYGVPSFFDQDQEFNELTVLDTSNKESNPNTFTKDIILSSNKLDHTNWKAFYIADRNFFTKTVADDTAIGLFIVLACFAITFPISFVLSTYLSTPIKQLLKSMKRFQNGHFEEQVPIVSNDEIGELSRGYNKMVINTKALINDLYVLQLKEKEAELKILQAQINPHFLYNSLDVIYWKALSNNENDIGEMIFSLSQIFRLCLNRGNDLIKICEEITLVKHYLFLQKMRFKENLEYNITLSEEIQSYLIPKLIIQPFVENAIVHGCEHLEKSGIVEITGLKENQYVVITIVDNGIGMHKLTIDPSKHSGYATTNIRERLTLIYGDQYTLEISSQRNIGTKVIIKLPWEHHSNSLARSVY